MSVSTRSGESEDVLPHSVLYGNAAKQTGACHEVSSILGDAEVDNFQNKMEKTASINLPIVPATPAVVMHDEIFVTPDPSGRVASATPHISGSFAGRIITSIGSNKGALIYPDSESSTEEIVATIEPTSLHTNTCESNVKENTKLQLVLPYKQCKKN